MLIKLFFLNCIQVSDGTIIFGIDNAAPQFFYGYNVNLATDNNTSFIYVRTSVTGSAQASIHYAVNRYLFLCGRPATFSSKFLLLVTYNNTAKDGNPDKCFTFQMALASDGIQSFVVVNYERLDENTVSDIGYSSQRGFIKLQSSVNDTRDLVLTSNIGMKGMHVMPLKG